MIRDALANRSTNESILQNITQGLNGSNNSINNLSTNNLNSNNQTNQSINLTGGISDISLGQLSLSTVSMVLAAGLITSSTPAS